MILPLLFAAAALASGPVDAIREAAHAKGVPFDLLYGICKVESGLDPLQVHHDDGGSDSIGLCQLKLATARWMGFRGRERDLYAAKINALFAAQYVAFLLTKHSNDSTLTIAAYNSGRPKYRKGKLINERYVRRVERARASAPQSSIAGPREWGPHRGSGS